MEDWAIYTSDDLEISIRIDIPIDIPSISRDLQYHQLLLCAMN